MLVESHRPYFDPSRVACPAAEQMALTEVVVATALVFDLNCLGARIGRMPTP